MGRLLGRLPGGLLSFTVLTLLRETLSVEPTLEAKYRAVRASGASTSSTGLPTKLNNVAKVTGFATTNGTEFYADGKPLYFAGTNAYYLAIRSFVADDDVVTFFQTNAKNGVNIVRFFGFVNGYGSGQFTKTPNPIQPRVGLFDEAGLQRLDLILKTASDYGQRVIMTMVNYEDGMISVILKTASDYGQRVMMTMVKYKDELGGMQWYVDEILGYGRPKEAFYTNPRVKDAFKGYIRTILERVNTVTGLKYKDDPAIFSVELANEPHTSDDFEKKLGAASGKIVRDWIFEIANYVRSVDKNHMISTGEEGYRIDGPEDPLYPQYMWLNNGTKGVDFSGNILCGNISFATVHIYPDNWGIDPQHLDYVNHVIADRAKLAHNAGKPFVVEEYGMASGYMDSRQTLLTEIQSAANAVDAAATLVWQVYAWPIDPTNTFNFDWSQPGNQVIRKQINFMKERTAGTYIPVSMPAGCNDIAPPSPHNYTCHEQANVYKQCNKPWMAGYCRASCGVCITPTPKPASECTDVAPPSYGNFSCHEQAIVFKHCGEVWMGDYCNKSCGRCGTSSGVGTPAPIPAPKPEPAVGPAAGCTDIPPENEFKYSCFQQAVLFGQCHQPWMKGFCLASCNACPLPSATPSSPTPIAAPSPGPSSSPAPAPSPTPTPAEHCTDEPPNDTHSCYQQAVLWSKCDEPWMKGKCNLSCGRCGEAPCLDIPPPSDGNYTCQQQAVQWGHCSKSWMKGYCQASCGGCKPSAINPTVNSGISNVARVLAYAPAPSSARRRKGSGAPGGVGAPPFSPQPETSVAAPAPAPGPGHDPTPKFDLPCNDIAPPSKKKYSCLQQAVLWGKCGEPWMSNYCHASCGRCSSVKETILSIVPAKTPAKTESTDAPAPAHAEGACADIIPPMAVGFTCDQAANLWGQCDEPWMDGYCLRACGRCSSNPAVTSSVTAVTSSAALSRRAGIP